MKGDENDIVTVAATNVQQAPPQQVTPTSTSVSEATVPQVLTRTMIPNLSITSLDAGDVIECYLLTRKSMLQGTVIQITKSALGLRFRHRPATGRKYDDSEYVSLTTTSSSSSSSSGSGSSGSRRRLELTIEYGPARAGNNLAHESIPHIVVTEEQQQEQENDPDGSSHNGSSGSSTSTSNNNNNNNNTNPDPTTSTVSWDNEGKVYYTESIDSDSYTSANYLASLSGTLLSKLLHAAVDFTQSGGTMSTTTTTPSIHNSNNQHPQQQQQQQQQSHHRRRRYQPFSVYLASTLQPKPSSTDNNSTTIPPPVEPVQILRSNSDSDFIYHLLTLLTDLGVELKPVILPVVTEIRLHAVEMKKIQIGLNHHPADFYQKLLTCVKAIGSTDYSVYNISKAITTDVPTISPNLVSEQPPTISFPSMIVRPPMYDLKTTSPTNAPQNQNRLYRYRFLDQGDSSTSVPTISSDALTTAILESHQPSALPPTTITNEPNNSTLIPTPSPTQDVDLGDKSGGMDMATHQEQAATAAQHAQEAAEAAGAADTEDEAVSAAQQAAVYAQKAATVTANQAALIAREAIISGVGSSVAQAVSLCFSDPLYGIANKNLNATSDSSSNTEPVSTTTVYLYWDGSFYYRMNLTAPYVTVASYARPMPKPPASKIGAEDFVDWSIAFILAVLCAIGFLLLLQHVMGRNLKLIRPLYRCQLWFFQPTRFDWDVMMNESEAARDIPGEYTFGEDAIPLSMGGRKVGNIVASVFKSGSSHSKNYRMDEWHESNSYDEDDDDNFDTTNDRSALVEMEMVDRSHQQWMSPSHNNSSSHSKNFRKGTSFHSEKSFGEDEGTPATDAESNSMVRLFRDPNLVDLPDLTSSSRVAMPVSSNLQIV